MERCQLALRRGSHLVSGGNMGNFCISWREQRQLFQERLETDFFLPLSLRSSHETAGEFGRG